MSDFHDVLFPPDISYGSSGGPKFKTSVWSADSGFEARVAHWPKTRAEYDVSHGVKTQGQAEALTTFFMNRRGRAYGFRFKDFNDYKLENQTLGIGDYATSRFQLSKDYTSNGPNGEVYVTRRLLDKIEWGSEKGVQIDGTTITKSVSAGRYYRLDYNTGQLTLNTPMWGGRYAGATPLTKINWRPGEFTPDYNFYTQGSNTRGVFFYASKTGRAFVQGGMANVLGTPGLIRFNLPTAEVDAKASPAMMSLPGNRGILAIGAVSPSGMLYLINEGSNTTTMHKVDGMTMQYVSSWGDSSIWPSDDKGVGSPWSPGCVSANEQYLLWADLWGNIDIHSADTMVRVAHLGRFGGITSQQYVAATPYKEAGFAFVYERPSGGAIHGCGLRIWMNGAAWIAETWGSPTARPTAVYCDKKTGGVLVFWRGEEAVPDYVYDGYDHWAGLFLPDEGRWAWQRRMPPGFQSNYARTNCQVVLDGELFWVRDTRDFGKRLWRIDTETGTVESRPVASSHDYQVFDPARKYIGGVGGYAILDPPAVISTDLNNVSFTPPETLTLSSVEYHIGVRFDTDHLNMKHEFWTYRSWESIPLVEVRDWTDLELD
ncbi:hypothetical protein GURKE_03490 [Brevundimonas phage vB_BpoS-Gurke]|uniref:DUF2460 domain-containing protein n=1 Tax=Brevundimonas phage vB_BpoS-Gurke TaxID=2948599 RepID=A0A9E7N3U5_9CAUD|nr:hypothetical protein GURKE_03490 [Brevundimonas phage vB_BpoS-Gurke]